MKLRFQKNKKYDKIAVQTLSEHAAYFGRYKCIELPTFKGFLRTGLLLALGYSARSEDQ